MDLNKFHGVYHHDDERVVIYQLAKNTPNDAHILNIGIEYGGSVHLLRTGNPTAIIHAVDLIGADKVADQIDGVKWYRGDSGKLAKKWTLPLDAIFIDGDHTTNGVIADCEFIKYLKPGCVVSFHDCTGPAGDEVSAGVDAWFAKHADEFVELEQVYSIRSFKRIK